MKCLVRCTEPEAAGKQMMTSQKNDTKKVEKKTTAQKKVNSSQQQLLQVLLRLHHAWSIKNEIKGMGWNNIKEKKPVVKGKMYVFQCLLNMEFLIH